MSGLWMVLSTGVVWATEDAELAAEAAATILATDPPAVPTDGGSMNVSVDKTSAVTLALVRLGSPSEDAARRGRGEAKAKETEDERFARTHSDYERMAIRVELAPGFFEGTGPATVKMEIFEDPMAARLVTSTTYTLDPGQATTLPDQAFPALWESATKADGHDTTEVRRALLVRISVRGDDGAFALVRQRLLTVVYNPRFVPSAVTHASLVGVQWGGDGATADLVSFAPAGFHLRATPLARTAWFGLAADLALLDTSAFSAGASTGATDDAGEGGGDDGATAALALQPGVVPARFTAGFDATYNHGFFDGKHIYVYGGVGLKLTDASSVGLVPVFGASLVIPLDLSGK